VENDTPIIEVESTAANAVTQARLVVEAELTAV
jgi:hypothetical protein